MEDVREDAVKLVCRMVTSSAELGASFSHVCGVLLSRLNDPVASIRVLMVQSVPAIYAKLHEHRDAINGVHSRAYARQSTSPHLLFFAGDIKNRLRDVDDKVRKAAVTAVCEMAAEYSD